MNKSTKISVKLPMDVLTKIRVIFTGVIAVLLFSVTLIPKRCHGKGQTLPSWDYLEVAITLIVVLTPIGSFTAKFVLLSALSQNIAKLLD